MGPIDLSDGFVAVGGLDGSVNLHPMAGGIVQDRRIRLAEPRPAGDKTAVAAVSFSPDAGMLAVAWVTGEVAGLTRPSPCAGAPTPCGTYGCMLGAGSLITAFQPCNSSSAAACRVRKVNRFSPYPPFV